MKERINEVVTYLAQNLPTLKISEDESMAKHASFKAGGKAGYFIEVNSVLELSQLLKILNENSTEYIVLGNGSNTLFTDEGYDGIVIKLNPESREFNYIKVLEEGEDFVTLSAGTAVLMSVFAKEVVSLSLEGFEPMSGIPGSLGGAVFMNAGAYGGEMSQVVKKVKAVSKEGEIKILSNEEMDFGYRHSILEDNHYIATDIEFSLKKGNLEEIKARMMDFAGRRNSKQPLKFPSAGSTFKRPDGYFAGKLIEDAGLKGLSVGGAEVSVLHSGFIINKNQATATDILELITLVQNTVYDKFGVKLEPEVRIIG